MNKVFTIAGLTFLLSQTIVAQQTINEVLTVNTSGANTMRIENDIAGEEATIRFRSKPSNGSGWLHADISSYASNSNTGFLGFKVPHDNTFGSGFDMIINHSGNVGIGTTSPSQQLHITKKLRLNWNDSNTSSTDDSPTIYASGQGASYPFSGRGNLILQTRATNSNGFGDLVVMTGQTATPKFIVRAEGNVGIGTTNPLSKLSIQGDGSTIGSATINFKHIGNGMSIGLSTSSNDLVIGNSWNPESGTYLTIQDGTGKIGVGTSDFSGNHKLRVEGSIGAREIKVEASGWSDFVFDNSYELRTLEEVEQHIVEKGHLPEVPSETEVAENGINLGEMDAKLLQKIEELTLYLIEQNKQNQSQQARIEQLEKELKALKN